MRVDSTLGMIAIEVERSFDHAVRALQRHRDDVATIAVLDEARRSIGQVRGALRVADVAGAPRVLFEIEQLLDDTVQGRGNVSQEPEMIAARMERVRSGLDAVRHYVNELAAGAPPRPMALAGVLQDMLVARGSDRPADLELFDANVSRPLPDAMVAGDGAPSNAMRDLRTVFQKGLLDWLRGDGAGLRTMRDIVARAHAEAPEPAPWWIAGAFIDHLDSGALPASVHVKRVFAGLDQYFARLLRGSTELPEALMREMLYFTARGETKSVLVAQVRDHYQVAPVQTPSAAAPILSQAQSQALFHTLQELWEKAADGDLASARSFAAQIGDAKSELPKVLTPLLETLRCAADALADSDASRPRLALEVASALLAMEDAMKPGNDTPGLAGRADAMSGRIRRAMQNLEETEPDWSDLTGEVASGKARQRNMIGALGAELAQEFDLVEQRLAAYFSDRGDVGAIQAAEQVMTRAHGTLQVLGDEHASAAVAWCIAETARLRDAAHTNKQQTQANLAAVVSALSFYAERLGQDGIDLARILRRADAPADVCVPPAGAIRDTSNQSGLSPDMDLSFVDQEEGAATLPQAAPADAASPADGGEWDVACDADLLTVFVEEALEVLSALDTAVEQLRADRRDADALAVLRRGFHTLKGSGRMLDLGRFAQAAYALEKLLDDQLGRDDGADETLLPLLDAALPRFQNWVNVLRADGRVQIDSADPVQWLDRAKHSNGDGDNAAPEASAADDAPTVEIGEVRLSQTLFDVFIGEARRITSALVAEAADVDAVIEEARGHERFRLAHTLCGIAGTTGFSAMRGLAGALEAVLRPEHALFFRSDADHGALFKTVAAALQDMLAAIESRNLPEKRGDLEAALQALLLHGVEADTSDGAQRDDDEQPDAEQPFAAQQASPMPPVVGRALQAAVQALADQLSETGVLEVTPAGKLERRRLRIQDDIDATLLPVFIEEAADLVPQIGEAVRNWRANPQQHERHRALTRLLHTFKGGARMAGAMALGELTHSMETRVATAARLPFIPDSIFDGLEVSFDRMGALLERIAPRTQEAVPADLSQAPLAVGFSAGMATQRSPADDAPGGDASSAQIPVGTFRKPAPARSLLRVRVDLLERLTMEAGEMAISRSRVEGEVRSMRGSLREMGASIARLRGQVREMEIQAESQIQSRQVQADEPDAALDPLELDRFTRLQELARLIDESANDATSLQQTIARNIDGCDSALAAQARMTRVLQDSLVSVRMIPFASLNERLYRVVRLTARDAGRRASLDIRGSAAELDRGVVDRIASPLEHLLRNAVVHGIEPAEERRAAGKPEAGEIVLELSQEGNEVLLTMQDDGRGFDLERLRVRAVEAGLISSDSQPSPEQIVQLAFAPGVSTAGELNESAGRGVGLDVVRSELTAVGGRVDVVFEPQRGTLFTIRLPLTMTVMQALVVRCAGQLFALPAMMVEQVRTLKPNALERVSESGDVDWQGNRYPLYDLRELLVMRTHARGAQAFTPIVLVRGGAQRAAIRIDELVAHEEVVMKDLGRQLASVTGIVGAAVRGSGEIVLILNPMSLVQKRPQIALPTAPTAAVEREAPAAACVLVVDDSLTVRKITSRVLTRRGYRVIEARDGLEALDRLADEQPVLVLLDVEMPRMDGFEVLRRMRGDPRWRSLPVMMITSRTAEKHRNHAFELGADAFLGKPFEEQELLAQVSELTERERA